MVPPGLSSLQQSVVWRREGHLSALSFTGTNGMHISGEWPLLGTFSGWGQQIRRPGLANLSMMLCC